jgi:hypothetical protein
MKTITALNRAAQDPKLTAQLVKQATTRGQNPWTSDVLIRKIADGSIQNPHVRALVPSAQLETAEYLQNPTGKLDRTPLAVGLERTETVKGRAQTFSSAVTLTATGERKGPGGGRYVTVTVADAEGAVETEVTRRQYEKLRLGLGRIALFLTDEAGSTKSFIAQLASATAAAQAAQAPKAAPKRGGKPTAKPTTKPAKKLATKRAR